MRSPRTSFHIIVFERLCVSFLFTEHAHEFHHIKLDHIRQSQRFVACVDLLHERVHHLRHCHCHYYQESRESQDRLEAATLKMETLRGAYEGLKEEHCRLCAVIEDMFMGCVLRFALLL